MKLACINENSSDTNKDEKSVLVVKFIDNLCFSETLA
jgi:hypothetical protein